VPVPALLLRQSLSAVIIFLIFILFGQPTVFFHTVKQSTVTHTNHSHFSTQSSNQQSLTPTIPSQPNQPSFHYIAVTSVYSFTITPFLFLEMETFPWQLGCFSFER
jgi:hypothetical protein